MRWLSGRTSNERGAAGVMVAVLVPVLLGMGAVAVDVGNIFSERAQLQNGADSSALAIAQTCSKNPTGCAGGAQALANQYTPANSQSDNAVARSVTLDTTAGTVTVQTSTPVGGLALTLAQAIGQKSMSVTASATARWGYPGSGAGFPLGLSNACFDLTSASPSGLLQKFSYKPSNGNNNGGDTKINCTNSSGTTIPGGWGWLAQTPSGSCQASTTAGGTVASDTGNNPASACSSTLTTWMNTLMAGGTVKVEFPVFQQGTGVGNTGYFTILGYATLQIYGWQFSGTGNTPYTYVPSTIPNSVSCSGSERCVIGKFVSFQSTGTGGTGGPNYGTSLIGLTQ